MTFAEKNSAFRQRVMDNLKERGFTVNETDSFWLSVSRDGRDLTMRLSPYAYFDGDPEKLVADWEAKI